MRRIGRWLWLALVGLAMLSPGLASAEVNMEHATKAWHQADTCAHAAFLKYPDYTPTSNAKREAARRDCLRNHSLPDPGAAAVSAPAAGAKP